MKKTFILFVALFMVSCSGEIYEDELRVGEDNLAYVGDTDKLYSGDVLDKYGEKLGTYKKGIKDGAWTEIDYKNGTRRKANYIKGTPEGEQITYVFPGPMDNNKRLEYINYENGKPVGTWTQWSRDNENRLRKTGEIVFEEGAGRWREWDPNTLVVVRAGDYENWERSGLWKSWDPQEVLVSEGEYVGGIKVNKWTWYKDGEDKGWEENYNNGVLNGKFNNLSPYAKIRGVGSFSEGVKTGEWEEYYSSAAGSLERSQSGAYQFGKKVGLWSLYAKNGRRIAEGTYINDQKEGEWTEGQDIDFGSRFFGKGTYANNRKNGTWVYVAPRQNPTIEGSFTDGEPSGEWKIVYDKKTYKGSLEELIKEQKILQDFNYNLPPYIEKSENFASNDCDLDFVRDLLIVHNRVVYGDRLLGVEFTSKLLKNGNIDYYILYATRSGGTNMEIKKTNCFEVTELQTAAK